MLTLIGLGLFCAEVKPVNVPKSSSPTATFFFMLAADKPSNFGHRWHTECAIGIIRWHEVQPVTNRLKCRNQAISLKMAIPGETIKRCATLVWPSPSSPPLSCSRWCASGMHRALAHARFCSRLSPSKALANPSAVSFFPARHRAPAISLHHIPAPVGGTFLPIQ
jgi:hypothetical protein